MATKTYRLSPDAPELTFAPPLPGKLEPGEEFELDAEHAVANVHIEVKQNGKWASTYVDESAPPKKARRARKATKKATAADAAPAGDTTHAASTESTESTEPNGGDE